MANRHELPDETGESPFAVPADVTYLNTAYFAPRLEAVTAAGREAIDRTARPWEISAEDWEARPAALRRAAAELFGVPTRSVAFVPSVSYGVAIAARNIPVRAGENLVVRENQFPSNYHAWARLANARGAELRAVAREADGTWTAGVVETIDAETAAVAVPHCHWTDGSLIDLDRVAAAASAVDAALVIDASQSLGAHPLDIDRLQPDFVVSVGYKWQLGPYSLAYLYAAPKWQELGVPLEESWLTRGGDVAYADLVDYDAPYRDGAMRFDVGEFPNFTLVPMATAALEQLNRWGAQKVSARLAPLTDRLAERARALDCAVPDDDARVNHLIGIEVPGGVPDRLRTRLDEERIDISILGDTLRVSPHLHNDLDDIDRFLGVLEEVLAGGR